MNSAPDEAEKLLKTFEEIQKENEMYKMILDALPINLFVKDKNCQYQITSRYCDLVNGVARGGLKGKTDFDLQKSEDIAQLFYDDDQKIIDSKQGSRILSPTLCGSDIRYYDIYKEPLVNAYNQVVGILGLVIEPGSTTQNEISFDQNLQPSNNIDSFIFDYEVKTGKIIVLKEMEELNSLGKDFEMEMWNTGRIADDDIDIVLNQFQKIRDGETQCISIFKMQDDRKQWRYCTLSLTAFFNRDMTAVRALGVLSFIDDSIRIWREIDLSIVEVKKHFSSIIRNRFETILYINSNTARYAVLESSSTAFAMSGTIETLKEYCRENFHPDDRKEILEYLSRVSNAASGCHSEENQVGDIYATFEKRIKRNEEYCWNKIEVFPFPALDGKKTDYVITTSDVDDIVKIRKQLEIRQANNQIIEVLSSVVESRDFESGNHIKRIKEITKELLIAIMERYPKYGLDSVMIEVIVAASAMHDIGKIAIPDTILLKPGKLSNQEFELMKQHTLRGCDIINNTSALQDKEYYQYCYDICRHHHERYDGNGYPDGLQEDEISIAAQVVSLADVYDALLSKRCYKDAYEEERVYKMIMKGECGVFNPILLECLKIVRKKLKNFYI